MLTLQCFNIYLRLYSLFNSLVYSKAHVYRNTFTPVLFVKVTKHARTLKYRDDSISASSTCILQIITVPLH